MMTVIWDGKVLLDTIIQNEEKSARIYADIADRLEDEELKTLFNSLSLDEEGHAKIYEAIKRSLEKKSEIEVGQEDVDYIELLIGQNVFSLKGDQQEEIEALLGKYDVFSLAEKLERDAILYILELEALYPGLATLEIERILKEERKHLRLVYTKKIDNIRKSS